MAARVRRGFLQLLCACLLFAQQVALNHALWHSSRDIALHEQRLETSTSPNPFELSGFCGFDAAFNQLLAGAPASHCAFAASAHRAQTVVHRRQTLAAADQLLPRSRGPPLLL